MKNPFGLVSQKYLDRLLVIISGYTNEKQTFSEEKLVSVLRRYVIKL